MRCFSCTRIAIKQKLSVYVTTVTPFQYHIGNGRGWPRAGHASTARPELHKHNSHGHCEGTDMCLVPMPHISMCQTLPKLEVINKLPGTTDCRFCYSVHPATDSANALRH